MNELQKETKFGYTALRALRDFYLEIIKEDTIDGKYKGKLWVIDNANALDLLVNQGITISRYDKGPLGMKK